MKLSRIALVVCLFSGLALGQIVTANQNLPNNFTDTNTFYGTTNHLGPTAFNSTVVFGTLTGGGTQCLEVNNTGTLEATGSACGAGGSTVTSVTGTTNQIAVVNPTTTPVLSLSPTLVLPGSLTLNITGSNQCLEVDSAGLVVGTGAVCNSGSGGGGTVTQVIGTTNQINVSNPTLTPTLTLSSTLVLPGTLTLNITGSTQCLEVNTSGVVSGTGSTCGSSSFTPQVNGTNLASTTGINILNSTVNAVGLTLTATNPSSTGVKYEITGGSYTGNAATATTATTASNLVGCTPSTAGSVCIWNGTAWTLFAGNTSGTSVLTENSSGTPSWGSGSSTAFQVNSTPLISASTVNFLDSASTDGLTLTVANPSAGIVQLGFTGQLTNAGLANPATTVNSQTCTLGTTCTIPFLTNSSVNASEAGVNFSTSTTNSVGLTVTPVNSATNVEKFEVTGSSYLGNAATATQLSTTGSTGTFWGSSGGSQSWQSLPSAGSSTLGVIELNTDLGGTATAPQVVNLSHVTNASLANSGLVNASTTVSGVTCTLGGSCTVPGTLPSGNGAEPLINSSAGTGTSYATSALYYDASQFSGATVDVQINKCSAWAITNNGGTCDARALAGTQTIASQINVGQLGKPTITFSVGGGSFANGTYKGVYTLVSPAVSEGTSASSETTVTLTGCSSNCTITFTSPSATGPVAYSGTATAYTPCLTAASGSSWTETCAASTTAIGTNAVLTTAPSGGAVGTSNKGFAVAFIPPVNGLWNATITDGVSCPLTFYDQSSYFGQSAGEGRSFNVSANSSATNVYAMECTDQNPKNSAGYYMLNNLSARDVTSATMASGAVTVISNFDDASQFPDLHSVTFTTGRIVCWIWGGGDGGSFPNLQCEGSSVGEPLRIGNSTGNTSEGVTIGPGISAVHPGAAYPAIEFTQGIRSVHLIGETYTECGSGPVVPTVDFVQVASLGSIGGTVGIDHLRVGTNCGTPSTALYGVGESGHTVTNFHVGSSDYGSFTHLVAYPANTALNINVTANGTYPDISLDINNPVTNLANQQVDGTLDVGVGGGGAVTLGSTAQSTTSSLLMYGCTTSSNLCPPYINMENEAGTIGAWLYPSTSFNGTFGIASSAPTTDVPVGGLLYAPGGMGPVYTTGSSSTTGLLQCPVSATSSEVQDCGSNAINFYGVAEATANSNTRSKSYGVVTVNIPASTTNNGDFICSGTLSAATYNAVDNGSTACPAGQQVGFATIHNASTVTSVKVQLTSAGGGSGTVTASPQYDIAYYTQSGTTAQVGGAAISGFQFDSTSGAPVAATAANLGALLNIAQYAQIYSNGTAAAPLGLAAPTTNGDWFTGYHITGSAASAPVNEELVASTTNTAGITITPTYNATGPTQRFEATVGALVAGTSITTPLIDTTTHCAAAGTAANPSVASCSAAPAGFFSCATNASTGTCVVDTTAVTANSVVQIQPDSSLGTALSVTCNTTADSGLTAPRVSARSAGTSFTITLGTFSTNPECFSYIIVN